MAAAISLRWVLSRSNSKSAVASVVIARLDVACLPEIQGRQGSDYHLQKWNRAKAVLANAEKTREGIRSTAPRILNLNTGSGEWKVSGLGRFTTEKNIHCYPPRRRLEGLRSRSGRFGGDKKLLPLRGIELEFQSRQVRRIVNIRPTLSRLHFFQLK